MRGFVIAAPSSGSGKTTLTLAILRALKNRNLTVRSAKSGPDYIDPKFHAAATGQPCVNLDAWAMSPAQLRSRLPVADCVVVEGAMGLFDGAPPDNRGSAADLAAALGLPVVLVVDAGKMAGSIAPLVSGFVGYSNDITIAGVILNNVGSPRHDRMLRRALDPLNIPVFGTVFRNPHLALPSRHLGLVQAQEHGDLDQFLELAAKTAEDSIDLNAILALSAPPATTPSHPAITPPAQRIAIAQDVAFAFSYPHLLSDWRDGGAEIISFSPLANDPVPDADFIYLPGGYPELFAGQIAQNATFLNSLRKAAQDTVIYGECGGYMTLGDTLTDADGVTHKMAGLLALETSFAKRKLHLGYRTVTAASGPFAGTWSAHEFHYATTLSAKGDTLFTATDAEGTALPDMGLRNGSVSGSFAHLICPHGH